MSEEKITGVCVDIPTVIKEAKLKRIISEKLDSAEACMLDAVTKAVFADAPEEEKARIDFLVNGKWDAPNPYKTSEWISVAERLPEEGVAVLVTNVESLNPFVVMSSWDSNASLYEFNKFRFKKYVSHWMPLPEPPKDCSNT